MKSQVIKPLFSLLLVGFVATTMKMAAAPVSRQQAQQNALAFMQERGKSIVMSSLRHAPQRAAQPEALQPYYVFNIGDNQGYVIASGDDCAYAVLGYSDEGAIDLNNLPCNLQAWLDSYAHQIQYRQEHGAATSRAPKKTEFPPAIEPMLTCHWSQCYPWNMYCPIDPTTGELCATGCAATAMAQVMYYHRARSANKTACEIPAYVTRSLGIHVDAIPAGTVIDWDNMVDKPNSYNATEVQKQAVANLMRYCGVALRMDYTSGLSGSFVYPYHLVRYFNYSPLAKDINRRGSGVDVTDEEWENLIYDELKNSRPVLYAITDGNNSNHEVVCDGYDGQGYYHINFGYAGSSDGFYLITRADGSIDWEVQSDFVGSWSALINVEPLPIPPNDDQGSGIHFIDPNTRTICLWIADANGDWVLTEDEAAAVTDASKLCFTNTPIISFDEFKYFTGITSIEYLVFNGCKNLKSITIPNSVTTIGEKAFYELGLTNISLGENVTTIGRQAFKGCSQLSNITIPNSVTTIGDEAFWNSGLTNIALGKNVTTIGRQAFRDCSQLSNITISNAVTTIGDEAFWNSGLTNISLGENVTTIGRSAFSGCSGLTSVTIPCSVTTIGSNVFAGCNNLKNLTWNAKKCESFQIPSSVEHLTFGEEIEVIPDHFASGCSGLTNVTVPNSVTKIGFHAFYYCSGLKSISIPSSVTIIGGGGFSGCNGLKSVTIPSTVTSLGEAAFSDCYGLTSVTIYADTVSRVAFSGCNNLKSITLGKSVKSIAPFAFDRCENVNTVTCLALIPPELSSIGFAYDFDLQQYKIPTLRVPIDAVDTYKATIWWNKFPNIVGIDPSLGDVNLDGEVNIADVNTIVDNILANSDDYMSDVNRDGEVNIADINTLIDKVLNSSF